jgi:hypothetical protein
MNTHTSLLIRLLCLLALGGAVVVGVLQRRAVAHARAEHQALLKDRDEVERLTRENAAMAQLRATHAQLAPLPERQRELARLRNEVVQLRAQTAEAEKLRAENERLASLQAGGAHPETNAMPAGWTGRAAMADAGLGSPEAAVQTYLYALCQGDVKRVLQCQFNAATMTPEEEQEQHERLQREFGNFPGYLIAEKNIISADEEEIGVQASPGGIIFPVHLVRNGNQWYALTK